MTYEILIYQDYVPFKKGLICQLAFSSGVTDEEIRLKG